MKLLILSGLIFAAPSVSSADAMTLNSALIGALNTQFRHDSVLKEPNPQNSLKILSNHKDRNQVYHQRLQQTYKGVKVVGGYAIIHSKSAKGLRASQLNMTGTLFRDLESDLAEKPLADPFKALDKLVSNYAKATVSEKQSELIIYIDHHNKAHWAYHVSLLAEEGHAMPMRPNVFFSADSLEPLEAWNDIKTLTHIVYGMGVGGNESTHEYAYTGREGDLPLLEISRDDALEQCFMESKLVKVIDMKNDYVSDNKAMKFECAHALLNHTYLTGYQADGYDRANGAFSPTNDAMFIGYVIQHMYKDWYNLDALSQRKGAFMQVVMRVHYGTAYENAFWDGKQMTFGDGDTLLYPLVSMGVGAHEISHGFTQQHSDLSYYSQSGGMNESFSDMAAMAATYYSDNEKQAPSFMIGDKIIKRNSDNHALRYMDHPSRDGQSLESAKDYYEGVDVHHSSGIFNRMFYLMATTKGWNTRKAFDVMVKANVDYWTPYETFKSGACGVLKATADYQYDLSDVESAIRKVGLEPKACAA